MGIGPVLAIVIVIAGCACIYYYNHFVARKNAVDQAYSTIDVMLQRRADLVPNLVAVVSRYLKHESETLTRIAELRSAAANRSGDLGERVNADSALGRLVGNLIIQVENYPELKADQNCQSLFLSLESMEGQISAARRSYNAAVTNFNNAIEMFPGNLLAGFFRFGRRELLQATPEERRVPSVKELFKD